jgi:hypothetical protein
MIPLQGSTYKATLISFLELQFCLMDILYMIIVTVVLK